MRSYFMQTLISLSKESMYMTDCNIYPHILQLLPESLPHVDGNEMQCYYKSLNIIMLEEFIFRTWVETKIGARDVGEGQWRGRLCWTLDEMYTWRDIWMEVFEVLRNFSVDEKYLDVDRCA